MLTATPVETPQRMHRRLGRGATWAAIALTFGLPKAGVMRGDFAFTLQLLVMLASLKVWVTTRPETPAERRIWAWIWVSAWWLAMWSVVGYTRGNSLFLTSQFALLLLGPAGYFLGVRMARRAITPLYFVTLLVSGYAVIQWRFGVEETAIRGLTTSDEHVVNQNPITTASGMLKAPSTYNNGNLLAASLLVMVTVLLLASPPRRHWQKLTVILALAAFALSLARSAIFGLALAAIVTWIVQRRARKAIRGARLRLLTIGVVCFSVLAVGFPPGNIVQERVQETLADPTARGRTVQYAAIGSRYSSTGLGYFTDLMVGVSQRTAGTAEGIAYLFLRGGILTLAVWAVGAGLLLVLARDATAQMNDRAGLIGMAGFGAVIGQFMVDSVLFYPPIALNLAIGIGIVAGRREGPR